MKQEVKNLLEDINLLTNESDLQESIKHVTGKEISRERALKNVVSYLIGNVYQWLEGSEINQDQDRELSFVIQQLSDTSQLESEEELQHLINESLSVIAGIFEIEGVR